MHQKIIDTIKKKKLTVIKIKDCYQTWRDRGHNRDNIDGWFFDWALNGIPKKERENKKSANEQPTAESIEVLNHINLTYGKHFTAPRYHGLINGWIARGYKAKELKVTFDYFNSEWEYDDVMSKHRTPGYVFGEKFEDHVNLCHEWKYKQ